MAMGAHGHRLPVASLCGGWHRRQTCLDRSTGSAVEPKRCLVLLPIGVTLRTEGPAFLSLYEHVLRPALLATGFPLAIWRGDEVLRSGLSLHQGRLWLQDPHLVVADLTTRHSGVLHDLRLRTFLAERTIL